MKRPDGRPHEPHLLLARADDLLWSVNHLEGIAALIATADTAEWDSLWVTSRRLTSRIESYAHKVSTGKLLVDAMLHGR
jgi:hypothetical protein